MATLVKSREQARQQAHRPKFSRKIFATTGTRDGSNETRKMRAWYPTAGVVVRMPVHTGYSCLPFLTDCMHASITVANQCSQDAACVLKQKVGVGYVHRRLGNEHMHNLVVCQTNTSLSMMQQSTRAKVAKLWLASSPGPNFSRKIFTTTDARRIGRKRESWLHWFATVTCMHAVKNGKHLHPVCTPGEGLSAITTDRGISTLVLFITILLRLTTIVYHI